MTEAFGGPGSIPTWTTGAKTAIGTSAGLAPRVWFTVSDGVVNEVYHPRVDTANIRDAQFLVAAKGFFSEEKRDTDHQMERLDPWAPAFRVTNTCRQGRYRMTKDIISDPERNVLLQRVHFEALVGKVEDYSVYALINPHLENSGFDNDAWVGDHNGIKTLYASRGSTHMAMMCTPDFEAYSVGFVGHSDGWQDISQHQHMTWRFSTATRGNVALTGQIGALPEGAFTLAIAFGDTPEEAAQQAHVAILRGFDYCLAEYVKQWQERTKNFRDLSAVAGDDGQLYRSSIQVFLSHEDKQAQGCTVASLSIPWGDGQTANQNTGGYHLVWPRDLVETALGRLAVDDTDGALQTLLYLASIQAKDGSWHQNGHVDGTPFWGGIQLDETAFPIILAWHLRDLDSLAGFDPWPMVKRAASYIAGMGPVTPQERWEEDGGYSPSTLAVAISALLCAADFARSADESHVCEYLNHVADWWTANLEDWTVSRPSAVDSVLPPHYARISAPEVTDGNQGSHSLGMTSIRNLPGTMPSEFRAQDVVDGGFLQLVYFGVLPPDDPYVLNTVQIVDKVLKVELPGGASWHRYNHDGYGEQTDGAPFQGWGIGQAWPLLTGERAHYELAAGHVEEARALAHAMEEFACADKLLSEQVWTSEDIPERGLFRGKPTGSGRPLVWAHAEYIKLLRSIADGRVFGMISLVKARYKEGIPSPRNVWRFNHKVRRVKEGALVRIETTADAILHWSADNWTTTHHDDMVDSGVGARYFDIPESVTREAKSIAFTFFWTESKRWEGTDFVIEIAQQ